MKDASLSWLNEIPAHWKLIKVRRCLREHRQGYYTTDPYVDEGIRLLRITDLCDSGRVDYSESPFVEDRVEITPFLLQEFDFVFARTGGAGLFGMIEEVTEPLAYASYLIRFRFDGAAKPQFLRYFFLSSGFQDTLKENIHGGVNQNVHAEDIKDQFLALPHIPEQQRIAAYLDEQTEKIDRLMDMRRRQMALLKEQRSALIQQAVTRGLNPNVPMKDSGLPWLGEIPEHWEVSQVRRLLSFVTSGSRGWAEFYSDDGAIFVQSGNLSRNMTLDLDNAQRVQPPTGAEGERTRLAQNDVLICVTGALTGNVAFVDFQPPIAYVNQHVALLRPKEKFITQKFLATTLWSSQGQIQFKLAEYGGTKQGLSLDDLRLAWIALPPNNEQIEILDFIQRESERIEQALSIYDRQLTLLTEYRAALIHECVTGQRLIPEAASL